MELLNRLLAAGIFFCRVQACVHYSKHQEGRLDVNYVDFYRPISNLCVLSKTFERVVAWQLTAFLERNNLPQV